MLKLFPRFTIVLFTYLCMASPTIAATRVALVIGNSAYKNSPLLNPVNDAKLMAKTLRSTGFTVTRLLDADQKTMKRALMKFGRNLRKSGAVGLFYYAGHGVQVNKKNYLVPIGANIQDESEVDMEAIDVEAFLGTMERSANAFNIVILDACRNNPFSRSFRSPARGLARVSAPRGSFVAYATAPGQIAFDGTSGHSPYTRALTKAMSQPGLSIEQVFKHARRDVLTATKERQIPWENSSITGDFYFMKHNQNSIEETPKATLSPAIGSQFELSYWDSIKNSKSRTLFRSYLQKYPDGTFSPIALEKVKSLKVE